MKATIVREEKIMPEGQSEMCCCGYRIMPGETYILWTLEGTDISFASQSPESPLGLECAGRAIEGIFDCAR
jgi:hypothetical protein